jgi:hypothetical protein
VDAEDAGVQTAIDESLSKTVLQRLFEEHIISGRQCEAGDRFAAAYRSRWPETSPRTCLNFEPVGHETLEDTEEEIQAAARWREICAHLPDPERAECERVCGKQFPPRNIDALRAGLDLCAGIFRIKG